MIRIGGAGKRGSMARVLGTWLGLTYLYASVAGAAGVAGCIHADHADAEPGAVHATHVPGGAHSDQPPPDALQIPCASGDHPAGESATAPSHHGPSSPCDCLGDCCMPTGPADSAAAADGPAWAPDPARTGTATLARSAPEPAADQYRLPYANAPPLL